MNSIFFTMKCCSTQEETACMQEKLDSYNTRHCQIHFKYKTQSNDCKYYKLSNIYNNMSNITNKY